MITTQFAFILTLVLVSEFVDPDQQVWGSPQ